MDDRVGPTGIQPPRPALNLSSAFTYTGLMPTRALAVRPPFGFTIGLFRTGDPGAVPAWRAELDRTAWRHHVLGSWVAALLNPLFALNDHAVMPERWTEFLVLRVLVSAAIVGLIVGRRRLPLTPASFVFVPFLLISLENAYMWSFMGPDLFRLHALAYAVLFVGASMIILWPLAWGLAVVGLTVAANVLFLGAHSALSPPEVMAHGGTLLAAVMVISTVMAHNRHRLVQREVRLREDLRARTAEAQEQRAVIEAAHRDLTDSIRYSLNIQQAVVPDISLLDRHTGGHFLLHRPKDIVSGDLPWCAHLDGRTIWTVADHTGHGVPGALMSILGSTLLHAVVVEQRVARPAEVLDRLRDAMIRALQRPGGQGPMDGMDIGLCVLDHRAGTLRFAGALHPLYRVRGGVLTEFAADRMPVGLLPDVSGSFTEQEVDVRPGDMLYLCSDGLQDQFGGPADRKFGRKRLKELLSDIAGLPMNEQERRVQDALALWQQERPSVDDVLVLGVRI